MEQKVVHIGCGASKDLKHVLKKVKRDGLVSKASSPVIWQETWTVAYSLENAVVLVVVEDSTVEEALESAKSRIQMMV